MSTGSQSQLCIVTAAQQRPFVFVCLSLSDGAFKARQGSFGYLHADTNKSVLYRTIKHSTIRHIMHEQRAVAMADFCCNDAKLTTRAWRHRCWCFIMREHCSTLELKYTSTILLHS
jgi:hypothetical protein